MSWQLASFAILIAVLAAGFVWWERSRPPARLVALVAALAALAVAGRLVFAPVPNLVATTDVALLTGYALGGAPGFAVGALAAPISNIWLGQGPWTAWQMAGWGLVGLGGAAAAAASGRRLSRVGLAIACGFAGLAYGALLDFSVMATYGGEQSLDRYLALSSRGVPFNIVHAVGNFALALAAGPALVRLISRYRTRLEFTWRPAAALPLLILALALPHLGGTLRDPPSAKAATGTLQWLERAQNDDGGFAASPDQPSSPAMTGWVMLGLEAAGRNPRDVERRGADPVSYLRAEVERLQSVGDLERTILALAGAGLDPTSFAGRDLLAELRRRRDRDGSVDGQVNLTAFYALALRGAGVDASRLGRSRRWLARAQSDDGGWGFQPGAVSDPDSTGAALQALAAVGERGKPLTTGVRYLRRSQRSNGGFALSTSGVVNAQSTAWAIQGMAAAGAAGDPRKRALAYLDSLRAADGHYRYSPASDQTPIWVTTQALLAVHLKPFPLPEVARATTVPPSEPAATSAPAPTSAPPSATGPVVTRGSAADGGQSEQSGAAGGGPGKPASGRGKDPEQGAAAPAIASETAAATPAAEAVPPSTDPPPANTDPDDSSTLPYLIAGLTAIAAALAGGFVWYRNRLP